MCIRDRAFWSYVVLILVPLWSTPGYELSLDLGWVDGLSIALWVVAVVLLFRMRKRAPVPVLGAAWFLLMLIPTSNIVQVSAGFMAERWVYLPSVGLLLAVVSLAEGIPASLWSKRAVLTGAKVAGVLVAAALLALCWVRGAWWHDDLILFRTMVRKVPNSSVGYNNLGLALMERGDTQGAVEAYGRALTLSPGYVTAHYNMALAMLTLGRAAEAVEEARRAVELDPEDAMARAGLGQALALTGKVEEGIVELQNAVALAPRAPHSRYNLAVALRQAGRLDEALVELRALLEIAPDLAIAREALEKWPKEGGQASSLAQAQEHHQRALTLARSGKVEEALAELRKAAELAPEAPYAWFNMGYLLLSVGRAAEAVPALERAAALDPEAPRARYFLGRAYLALGRNREAREQLEACLRLDPTGSKAEEIRNTLASLPR